MWSHGRVSQNFQVDLRGMVELLSRHLYSSPRVYLRELIQNGVDAITARRQAGDPAAPGRITIVPADVAADGCLHVTDTGIGLDPVGIEQVLATIGASSKRDELGFARESFIGQFGIGLLSCFMVCDEIRMLTRTAGGQTWEWIGRVDGTYETRPAEVSLPEQGTEVILRPRPYDSTLLTEDAVRQIASHYAAFLPAQVVVSTADGDVAISGATGFPWEDATVTGTARQQAAAEFCRRMLGFTPLAVVELAEPASGVRGFAYVTPTASARRGAHRLYAQHMLVNEAEADLLPEWAFFVQAVVDTDRLQLTASREHVHQDELLEQTREALGAQLKRWLIRTVRSDRERAEHFFRVHHLGVKAMATADDEMLEVVGSLLAFETTVGHCTLEEFSAHGPVLTYVNRLEDFDQIAPVAQALGVPVLNAGYAYDGAIIERWVATHPELDARRMSPRELAAQFQDVDADDRRFFSPLTETAEDALDRAGCRISVRPFQPEELHAVLLTDRESARELDRAAVAENAAGPWALALDTLAAPDLRPVFVLNAANPAVRQVAAAGDRQFQATAVRAMYAQVLISGRHPLRPFETNLVNTALLDLIQRALPSG